MPSSFPFGGRLQPRRHRPNPQQLTANVWELLPYSSRGGSGGGGRGGGLNPMEAARPGSIQPGMEPWARHRRKQQLKEQQQQSKEARFHQQQPASNQPARIMSQSEAAAFEALYQRKVASRQKDSTAGGSGSFQLVAAFQLNRGRVEAYHVYSAAASSSSSSPKLAGGCLPEPLVFQLTERRRRLLQRYYSQGRQVVALYLNSMQFEHYMPLANASSSSSSSSFSLTSTSSSSAAATATAAAAGSPGCEIRPADARSRVRSFFGLA